MCKSWLTISQNLQIAFGSISEYSNVGGFQQIDQQKIHHFLETSLPATNFAGSNRV